MESPPELRRLRKGGRPRLTPGVILGWEVQGCWAYRLSDSLENTLTKEGFYYEDILNNILTCLFSLIRVLFFNHTLLTSFSSLFVLLSLSLSNKRWRVVILTTWLYVDTKHLTTNPSVTVLIHPPSNLYPKPIPLRLCLSLVITVPHYALHIKKFFFFYAHMCFPQV